MSGLGASGLPKATTPLWVISLFVPLTEVMSGIAATQTSGSIQVALTAFVIAFPLLIAGAFFAFLWFRPHHLYAPSEYQGTKVKEYVDAMRRRVESEIDQLYALSMSDDAFYQLNRLNTGQYGAFWLDPALKIGLAAELIYFKILGYIEFKDPNRKEVAYLPSGDNPNDDLCNYLRVTPVGQEFIALRKKAQARRGRDGVDPANG